MPHTSLETLTTLLSNTHSANTILHYVENKRWFEEYKQKEKQQQHQQHQPYFSIPYKEWILKTLINKQYIDSLSLLIDEDEGDIRYNENTNTVDIWESEDQPFQSKTPKEHIAYICSEKRRVTPLINYLEEFYEYELRRYKSVSSITFYRIDYEIWRELFDMNIKEIESASLSIIKGYFEIQYNPYGFPTHIVLLASK